MVFDASGGSSGPQLYSFKRTEPQIVALHEACDVWQEGPEHFWKFDDVLAAIARPAGQVVFAASREDARQWDGAALSDVGPFTTDLLYVWVRPTMRKRGVARALLVRLCEELSLRPQMEALFLEVRSSNAPAQALYRSLGMDEVGRRRAYYADGEDALIFKQVLRDV